MMTGTRKQGSRFVVDTSAVQQQQQHLPSVSRKMQDLGGQDRGIPDLDGIRPKRPKETKQPTEEKLGEA